MSFHGRPAFERMKVIWAFIRAGYHPNMSDLARILETSTKSIQRDLDFMRDRLEMPIAYNNSWHGFEFIGPARCCFCCDTKAVTSRYAMELKPEPLMLEALRSFEPEKLNINQRTKRKMILAEARRISAQRRGKAFYRHNKSTDTYIVPKDRV